MANWNQTAVNKAVYLNGSTDYLYRGETPTYPGRMWAMVFRPEANTGNWQAVFSPDTSTARGIFVKPGIEQGYTGLVDGEYFGLGDSNAPDYIVLWHAVVLDNGTEIDFVNGMRIREFSYSGTPSGNNISLGYWNSTYPDRFKGWIGRLQEGAIPSDLDTMLKAGTVDWAEVMRYLQDTPWLDSPSHHWELGESFDDQVGNWHLTAYGSPSKVSKDMWKAPDLREYPNATVLEAGLEAARLSAELQDANITGEVKG